MWNSKNTEIIYFNFYKKFKNINKLYFIITKTTSSWMQSCSSLLPCYLHYLPFPLFLKTNLLSIVEGDIVYIKALSNNIRSLALTSITLGTQILYHFEGWWLVLINTIMVVSKLFYLHCPTQNYLVIPMCLYSLLRYQLCLYSITDRASYAQSIVIYAGL